jgi:uncharacterized membrane protein YqjE
MSEPESSSGQPLGRLRRLGGKIAAALQNRIELLGLELREEKLRLLEVALLGAVGFFFAHLGFLFLTLALAVLLREQAVWILAVAGAVYAALAAWCGLAVRRRLRNWPPAFSGTVAELKKDREWLSSLN